LEGLTIENLGIFFDHLVYLMAIGNMYFPFGIFCSHLVHFPSFGILYHEKSGNPDVVTQRARAAVIASPTGLPDGIFSSQKSQFSEKFWRVLNRKMLVHFIVI
jgi:hypothetical protein